MWTLLGARAFCTADAESSPSGERWGYCSSNLQVDGAADEVIALIERASRVGYTAVVLADYKLQILDRVPEFYFRNVERVTAARINPRGENVAPPTASDTLPKLRERRPEPRSPLDLALTPPTISRNWGSREASRVHDWLKGFRLAILAISRRLVGGTIHADGLRAIPDG